MDLPSQMMLFAQVVKAGSFSGAARALDHTPSSVSRQIGYLEDRVGVRLLNRSSNGLSLTGDGQAFYDRCLEISDRITEAETFANSLNHQPSGQLKAVSTVAFGKSQLLPAIPDFLSRYPQLSLSLELTDRKIGLVDAGIDLAIRFSEQLEDENDIARKIATNRRIVCAAPRYLDQFGAPARFTDLAHHNCLQLSTVESWNVWGVGDSRLQAEVNLSGNFQSNSADGIYHATLAGLGIARLSTYLVNEDIRTGRLVRILPDYMDESSDIVAVYPQRRNLSPNVRALIDFMVERFGGVPPWERHLPEENPIRRAG